ncbi:MAG: ketopantoate reductase family protein [Acidimicrobiales bacterium]|nr:ketopantoate reductase family protein [Acidimicrobiales bacterium]
MRIAIHGAGGLGLVLGGYLAQIGVDVIAISRPQHVEAIRRDGLLIDGIRGRHVVTDNLTAISSIDEIDGDIDYLILAVKADATDLALEQASVVLAGRVGAVLSVQNTVVKDHALAEAFGADLVLGASTIEGGTLTGPGQVRHTATCPTTMYVGELDGTSSPRVTALAETFVSAGFGTRVTDSIEQVEWEKLMQIATAAGFSVALLPGVPWAVMADGINVREGAEYHVALARELLDVYRSMGYEPQDYFAPFSRFDQLAQESVEESVQAMLDMGASMKAAGLTGRASMHEDVLHGRPTEVRYILGPFVERAAEAGIACPTLLATYRICTTIDTLLRSTTT